MISFISFSYAGEAFVIFKTRESAERVVRKLDTWCLLLPNGRYMYKFYFPGESAEKDSFLLCFVF